MHCEPVCGADHFWPDPKAREAVSAVDTWCFGLHPVEEREAELACAVEVAGALLVRGTKDRPPEVIVLCPVDVNDVACVGVGDEVVLVDHSAMEPEQFQRGPPCTTGRNVCCQGPIVS